MEKHFFRLLVMAAICMSLYSSCAGDDDAVQIVDGIRTSSGRKLTKLSISCKDSATYYISYDSHNRIKNVVYSFKRSWMNNYYDVNIDFDYELSRISLQANREPMHYRFYTNDKGLITRFFNYNFLYDDRENLKDVRGTDVFNLLYSGDAVISLVRLLDDKELQYDWYEYGKTNSKERYIDVEATKIPRSAKIHWNWGFLLIALQSGALGNTPILLKSFSLNKETTVHVTTSEEGKAWDFIFTYE